MLLTLQLYSVMASALLKPHTNYRTQLKSSQIKSWNPCILGGFPASYGLLCRSYTSDRFIRNSQMSPSSSPTGIPFRPTMYLQLAVGAPR